MMKEIIACLGGVAVGVAVCYCGYHYFKKKKTEEVETDVFEEKLKSNLEVKNKYITQVLGGEALDFAEIYREYSKYAEKIAPFVKDTSVVVYNNIKEDKLTLMLYHSKLDWNIVADIYLKDLIKNKELLIISLIILIIFLASSILSLNNVAILPTVLNGSS